jgi:ADP-heptose:LPS heptosyltransferase
MLPLRRVLLVRPDRIGDLVLSLPVAQALKKHLPGVQVDFLASSYNAPLLPYSPAVDVARLATDSNGTPRGRGDLARELAAAEYDAAVFLKPEWRTAHAVFVAGIPRRVGTWRRSCTIFFNERVNNNRRNAGRHEADLNLMLAARLHGALSREPGVPVLRTDERKGIALLAPFRLPLQFLVIHCGSGGSAANWPRQMYADLARRMSRETAVVLTGQRSILDAPLSNVFDLTGRTTFDQLVHVLGAASVCTGGSTGPIHIAAALGTPVIALYPDHPRLGPHRWAPRGPEVQVIVPPNESGHVCQLRPDGSCSCMDRIRIEDVEASVRKALVPTPRARVVDVGDTDPFPVAP